ncbi:hypothetical protein R50073_27630 [Maricurvus nonylphenolicus]|uniref:flagellin N-terminal helical domain-containing protein n=1 Tax=Maricurvus nonylphenolicus TaxID=1008307 RepID=UPI0036F2E72A
MPQIINTNISSLTAQRNLNTSQSDQAQALERLSSGLRINSAKDDAAGLAISTRFTSQTRGLSVAIRNAGDGISLSQTAEGALGSMADNLQRIRELALQSANGTNSDSDREALNAEAQQLIAEITRTADQTNFNGRNLLDGSFSSQFQIGANAGEVIDVSVNKLTADSIGAAETSGVSAIGTGAALANGDLIINGVAIDPSQASSDTASTADASFSAIAKVAAINAKSDATGVTAEVIDNVASGSEMTAAATSGTLTLNGVDIDLATGGVSASDDRNAVISAINARSDQTGVIASDGGDAGGVTLTAADGRNIDVSFGGVGGTLTSASTGLTEGTNYGGYTLISKEGGDISVDGGNGTGTGDLSNSGLTAGVYSGREATLNTLERNLSVSTAETNGTFTTADLGISAGTAVNATNNSFEISVDGGAFQTLTLDSAFDPSANGGTGSAGTYDNAADLALYINDAIANDANFQDAQGNALVSAAADGSGGITFTSTDAGGSSQVVARQGSGNIDIPTNTAATAGTAAGTFDSDQVDFIFDGTNALTVTVNTADELSVNVNGGGATDVTVAAGSYTDAQTFADAVNVGLQAAGLAATATISSDGTRVLIGADNSGETVVVAAGATNAITATPQADYIQHSNNEVVITDVAAFLADYDDDDEIGLAVDGAAAQDLVLDDDVAGYTGTQPPANATELADLINANAAVQVAGSGITASVVGGQVVISSDAVGGSVVATPGTGTPLAAAADLAGTDQTDTTVAATAGVAITGNFSVDADGNFVTEDPDGAGTQFESQQSPLVVTAGENDTFQVAVDGGTAQTVTVAAGSYNSLSELATAINTGIASSSQTIQGADISGIAKAGYDFANDGNLVFTTSVNGGAALTTTISTDIDTATATVAEAQEALRAAIQTDLDTKYGANQVNVAFNSTSGRLEFSTVDSSTTLTITADTGTGGSTNGPFVAAGTNIPAYSVAVSSGNQSLTFTSGSTGATSAIDLTNGTLAIEGDFVNGAVVSEAVSVNALESGDLVINGTSIRGASGADDTASDETALTSTAAASGIATAAAINASSAQTGVTATVNATELNGGDGTAALTAANGSTGVVYINNVAATPLTLTGDVDADRASAVNAINAISGQTGVVAEDNGKSITLTAVDGRNVSVAIDNQLSANDAAGRDSSNFGRSIGLAADGAGIGEADISGTGATYANVAGTTYSTVQLNSAGEISVSAGDNGADELAAIGLREGSYGAGDNGIFISEIDISTFEGANEAIVAIDNALNQVSAERANLGAIQNRFQSTISNLEITSENLTAANSRIRDADFAAETAALSRAQVLQQAGISVLAQANALPQQALSLLQ